MKLEVACVSVSQIASTEWRGRWDDACSNVELEIAEARLDEYQGTLGLMAWLQNKLHLCLLPPEEAYQEEAHLTYTKPVWRPITVPPQRLLGLRGMIRINAQAILRHGEKELDREYAEVVTAIAPSSDSGAELSPDIQRDAAVVQSGNFEGSKKLANELLESSTKDALRIAVRLFDNTERTRHLWTVIEDSPDQQITLDLMRARLTDPDLIPDYSLLINLTGMKARLDKPMEFDASDRQPYTEYHPELEDESVAYFRSLLSLLVDSSGDLPSARARAIVDIASSVAEGERCPLGTYGLSSAEAATIKSKLSKK